MLKALNSKILLAILAALTAIGGLLLHQNHIAQQRAADAAKARAILEQQQKQADEQKKEEKEFRKKVEEARKKSHSYDSGGSSVKYVP
jgi:Ni/Co efflux regulator RcnB